MAKIIFKCRYLKQGSTAHSENLIKYIATREGVQKIDDTWKHQPATKEQQKLIRQIVTDVFGKMKVSQKVSKKLAP